MYRELKYGAMSHVDVTAVIATVHVYVQLRQQINSFEHDHANTVHGNIGSTPV